MTTKPLIISHRGRSSNHSLPENSIEACEEALAQGATSLEVDVRFCGSGELVVFHDFTINRVTGKSGMLFSTTLNHLQNYPLENSISNKAVYTPTLKEFITHFKNTVPINLDAKVFTPIAGQFAKYIVRAVKASGYREQFWISSFNPIFLRTVKYCGWDIRTGFLFEKMDWFRRMSDPLTHADYWHPEHTLVDDAFLALAQKHNKELYVWTVNDSERANQLLQYNAVKGIISDIPDKISQKFGQK